MTNKKPHPYKEMLCFMNKARNKLIDDFRNFKRNKVNRKYMSHSTFDATIATFRKKIAELDLWICLARLSIQVSTRTGVLHLINSETKVIYAPDSEKVVDFRF